MNNCPPPSRIFRGRQTILDKMNQFFAQDIGKQHIYVLHGLGGAGKTQIALRFINLSQFSFSDNFFLDTSTTETIDASLKIIASLKNVGNTSQDALKWLANNQEDWLLFYDNADDPKIDLNRFIPQCTHGNIIITTRNPALRSYAGAHFAVSDMEESDAVELLLKSASQEIVLANQEIATKIVKELCYLPLAIVQAGAFILQSGALDSYLDIYMKNRAQLLSEKPAQSYDNYAWTVYTTWQMSFDQLSPPAAMFLQLCSFLHRDGISEDIFSRAATYRFKQAIPSREALQKPLQFLAQFTDPAGEWDTLRFLKVTNEIKAYSLMSFDPERKVFSIHPLVHSWSQTTITDNQSYHSIMAAIMGMSIREIPDNHQQLASVRLISHVDSLRHGNQQAVVNFGAQYGMIYWSAGRYEEAKELDLAVLEQRKQVLGDDHPDTLLAMGNLASTYQHLGKFHKAAELEVVLLEKQKQRKQVLGDDHPDTLRAMGTLASTYRELGKFHKAEELEVVVLEKQKQVLGDDHPNTLQAMGNLASTYNCQSEFHKAEELELVVLEKRKQVLGDDHPDTLLAMGNLGWTYHQLGQFQKAEELQVIVLEKRKKLLALMFRSLDKLSEAEELEAHVRNYEEAFEGSVSGNSQGSNEEASEDLTQS
ncbi:P-loop containing nucleoside triphosphate hydrolase protein [Mycena leptocephala]|nr:P-loop containing nucleoside triphosphate hydrolase protein [Mycena leptocephala]